MKIAILGVGSRGLHYGRLAKERGGIEFSALCDRDPEKLAIARETLSCGKRETFTEETDFFAGGKLADVLFLCTQDKDHYRQAMRALEIGYDILLEKPVSADPKECVKIAEKAGQLGRKVFVCHVLRYSGYYRKIKEVLESGVLGKVIQIDHAENISYWHFVHSYVRGNWRKEADGTPMIFAKCCHDMDLLYWWTGSRCRSVSSLGGLSYFTEANAPAGSTLKCTDCPLGKACVYHADYQYLPMDGEGNRFAWGTYALTPREGEEAVREALRETAYGTCVFRCHNDVCDWQCAQMEMEDGTPIQFRVNAFHNENYRSTHIVGTLGEIYGNDLEEKLTLHRFGKEAEEINLSLHDASAYGGGHVGGDGGMINDVLDCLEGKAAPMERMATIDETVESHRMAAACEQSRKLGGERIWLG